MRFVTYLLSALCSLSMLFPSSVIAQPIASCAGYFQYVFDIPGGYINDHSLLLVGDVWHLFFIQGTVSSLDWMRKGNEVVIGHATSTDLLHWNIQEPALHVGPEGALDAGHIYAPSVVERDGIYYMIYTGMEYPFPAGEYLFLATSTDLFNWTRYASEPILAPDTSWAAYHTPGYRAGAGGPVSGRDPFIFRDDRYGYICYYVARMKDDPSHPAGDQGEACVAAATSSDLIHWKDRGPVLIRRVVGSDTNTYAHPESPCVVKREGRYYLFWKGGVGTRYVVSDDPLDFQGREETVLATSHASRIVEWGSQWYITSCSREVDDVTHTCSDRTQGLSLAGLNWIEGRPVVSFLPYRAGSLKSRPSRRGRSGNRKSSRK